MFQFLEMSNTDKENDFFQSLDLVDFIVRNYKKLAYVAIVAFILSAVVSLLIPPKFKSTVILFPAKTNSLSKSLFVDDPTGKKDVMQFGEEEDAEQMMQILYSDDILSKLNAKYNLMRHYDIDSDDEYKYTNLGQEFEDNVSFKRTEYQSIRIDVLDEYPDTAAMMANDIASYIDSVKRRIQKQRAVDASKILKFEYDRLLTRIEGMEDDLMFYREKGVLEFEVQVEKYSEQLGIAINAGRKDAERLLQSKLDTLAKYGAKQEALTEQILLERERLIGLLEAYEEARVDAERHLPSTFIVNKAVPAEKKSYPVRWLIVLASTLSALLFAIITLVFLEEYNKKATPAS